MSGGQWRSTSSQRIALSKEFGWGSGSSKVTIFSQFAHGCHGKNINSTISQQKTESLLRRQKCLSWILLAFWCVWIWFSYKTLDYICFGLFWNNPRGAQIGTPVPAGGLRKQARCCPSQALDPGATSESWCFEFWPSWDTHLHRSSQQESHWLCFFLSGDFSFSFSCPKEFIYWFSFSCYKFV